MADLFKALISIANVSKSFLARPTFKSIHSNRSHASKLVGDIWNYLLEVDADSILTNLVLEALEGQVIL